LLLIGLSEVGHAHEDLLRYIQPPAASMVDPVR
jgi:hypothetical protein